MGATTAAAADLVVAAVVAAALLAQFAALFSTSTLVATAQWPSLLPRLVSSAVPGALVRTVCDSSPIPSTSLLPDLIADDAKWHPDCVLTPTLAVGLFSVLGIPEEVHGRLFVHMDADHDGALRWPEIARCHVGPGWGCQNSMSPPSPLLNDTAVALAGPTISELVWNAFQ
ncbi:hypothetical protein HK405_003678 [Cladochytrium tenue]|nr:hypothetical protein HK405_003678 [Cladochytrium tenue]